VPVVPAAPIIQLFEETNVRIIDSFGNSIVRDSTPFGLVFPWTRRAWLLRTWLPAHSFLTAYLEGKTLANIEEGSALWLPMIGLVGHREIGI
jgi:hypothetical protein